MYICLHMQRKFLEQITEKYKMLFPLGKGNGNFGISGKFL